MNPRRAGLPAVVVLSLSVVAVAACDRGSAAMPPISEAAGVLADSYRYVPAPPVRTYPSTNATIQRWISNANTKAIRSHGWDIWQSITSATSYNRPVWQTWYSGHELFEETNETHVLARAKHGVVQFGIRRNAMHPSTIAARSANGIPFDPAERVFAFNRFTASTAQFIWKNKLNYAQTLADTNAAFTRNNTPLVSRAILTSKDSTDSSSFVLKPVYQFISGREVTAVPYWNGDSSAATTDSANPIASTWRQAVAVDPTGKLQPGDSILLPVNDEGYKWCKVVPLSAFYWQRITVEDSINFSQFGAANGDFIGVANDTSWQAVLQAVRPGNIGLLMAMHTTGKEIPNWTWQSFWWGQNPNDPQFGADRPKTIPPPWNHYNMTVAYAMLTPSGGSNIAYNPYLESSLAGTIPNEGKQPPSMISWTGVTTNCMACHRRASVGYTAGGQPVGALYGPDMQVNAGDSVIFIVPGPDSTKVPLLKTDFLWSVAIRAAGTVAKRRK
jgi:hypothetical protein